MIIMLLVGMRTMIRTTIRFVMVIIIVMMRLMMVKWIMVPPLRIATFFTIGRSAKERFGPCVEIPLK